jgi:uncharacterized protein (DUF111 family)
MSTSLDLLSKLDQHLLNEFRPRIEQDFRANQHFEFSRFEIAEDEYNSERTKNYLTRIHKGQKQHIQSVKVEFTIKANTQELDMLYQVASIFETRLDDEIKKWSNEMVCNDNSLLMQPVTEIYGQTKSKDIKIGRKQVIGKIVSVIREFDLVYSA